MNERIKELEQQCVSHNDSYDPEYGWRTDEYFDKEKFIKLIVKECCDVLHDNEMGGYQVNYVLKEHFGVE